MAGFHSQTTNGTWSISDENAMNITIPDGSYFRCLTLGKDTEYSPPLYKRGFMFPAFTAHHCCHDRGHDGQRADLRQRAVMGLLVRV